MAVRLGVGRFFKVDATAIEDFELLPDGPITSLPRVVGTGTPAATLEVGTIYPRIP